MARAAVIGEAVRVQGFALAGAVVYPAEDRGRGARGLARAATRHRRGGADRPGRGLARRGGCAAAGRAAGGDAAMTAAPAARRARAGPGAHAARRRGSRRAGFSPTRAARRTRSARRHGASAEQAVSQARAARAGRTPPRWPPQSGAAGRERRQVGAARRAARGAGRAAQPGPRRGRRAAQTSPATTSCVTGSRGWPGRRQARTRRSPPPRPAAWWPGLAGVLVDCSLPRLADLAVDALGGEVRELWTP